MKARRRHPLRPATATPGRATRRPRAWRDSTPHGRGQKAARRVRAHRRAAEGQRRLDEDDRPWTMRRHRRWRRSWRPGRRAEGATPQVQDASKRVRSSPARARFHQPAAVRDALTVDPHAVHAERIGGQPGAAQVEDAAVRAAADRGRVEQQQVGGVALARSGRGRRRPSTLARAATSAGARPRRASSRRGRATSGPAGAGRSRRR